MAKKYAGGDAGTMGSSQKRVDKLEELKLKLADIDPMEIARQLTIVEHELFKAIRVSLRMKLFAC